MEWSRGEQGGTALLPGRGAAKWAKWRAGPARSFGLCRLAEGGVHTQARTAELRPPPDRMRQQAAGTRERRALRNCLMRPFLRGPRQITASSGLGSMKPIDITPRLSCAAQARRGRSAARSACGARPQPRRSPAPPRTLAAQCMPRAGAGCSVPMPSARCGGALQPAAVCVPAALGARALVCAPPGRAGGLPELPPRGWEAAGAGERAPTKARESR